MFGTSSRRRNGVVRFIGVAAILTIAALARLWRINSLPPGFHFDESFEGLEAWKILTLPDYRPLFLTGNFGVPPFNAYANAIMFKLVPLWQGEAGPTAMRTTAALFGIAGVLLVYLLGRELFRLDDSSGHSRLSAAFPFFAATVLAVMRWHVHFSRMGIEPIIVPAIWAGSMWLLLRGWRTGSYPSFAACGLFLATGMYTYQGAWVIPFLVTISALVLLWQDRASRTSTMMQRHSIGLLTAAGVAALLFLPLGNFFRLHPDLIFLRPTQLNIVGATGSAADTTIWANLWSTARMFGPFGQPGDLDPRRNLPGAPALNIWLVLPFYLGLGLVLWRLRRPTYALLLVGILGMLLPGIFSEYAPHFHRILGAAAPVALICGVGLDGIWNWGAGSTRGSAWNPLARGLAITVLVAGAYVGAVNYFQRWASLPDLFYAFDAGLWEVGEQIAAESAHQPLYLSPRAADHPTLAFAWRQTTQDSPSTSSPVVSYDGRHIFPHTAGSNPSPESYFVIEHEDFRTRLLLPELFPRATVSRVIEDTAGQVYARVYTRAQQSTAQRHPVVPLDIALGDGITLSGYDLIPTPARAGESLYVQLYWSVAAIPQQDWTVYLHLTDAGLPHALRAGKDSPPGTGSLHTIEWQGGWRVLDEYELPLPADLPPGQYDLYAGLYTANVEQLPADGQGVHLGNVRVE